MTLAGRVLVLSLTSRERRPLRSFLKIALSPRPRRSISDHIPFTTIGCILLQMDPVSHLLDVTMHW